MCNIRQSHNYAPMDTITLIARPQACQFNLPPQGPFLLDWIHHLKKVDADSNILISISE